MVVNDQAPSPTMTTATRAADASTGRPEYSRRARAASLDR